MKILFVCKHNRFRSKVAEALFNAKVQNKQEGLFDFYNKNPEIKAESAGVKLDFNPVEEIVNKILGEKGVVISNKVPRMLTKRLADEADKIIITANNVSADGFPKEKTEIWAISDCPEDDTDKIRRIIEEIALKIEELVESLQEK